MSGPTEPAYEINFEWKPVTDGEQRYVEEFIDGALAKRYGPMSPEMVEPLIVQLKAIVTKTFMRVYGEHHGKDPS